MFGEERKHKIIKYLENHRRATVQQLAQFLNVSEVTVRRDLKEIEEEYPFIKRTHGGAMWWGRVSGEPTVQEKQGQYLREKERIAEKAKEWIQEGDVLLLDAGTTVRQLIPYLSSFKRLTILTNSLLSVHEFQNLGHLEIMMLGGTLRASTMSLVGPWAEKILEDVHVDKAFVATNGIDLEKGLTTPNIIEASVKRKMIKAADEVILLADASKFGQISFAKFGEVRDIDVWITNAGLDPEIQRILDDVGVKVVIADA
ncbi:MAG: putative regulator of fructose utilization, DeoR family [Candidatus Carbobacillus altaicus]|uniref:Putative regulator of fructose utilization, DeoR family n=1 Tax=Candidatus Carbonibacillus altaicus TaxID=2163959 RepID=A0A2R6Y3X3_9BACL|nr:MAG: putative regulator of fructose utilization, DeoR family [Candidatus Carbobacillus altaicus]